MSARKPTTTIAIATATTTATTTTTTATVTTAAASEEEPLEGSNSSALEALEVTATETPPLPESEEAAPPANTDATPTAAPTLEPALVEDRASPDPNPDSDVALASLPPTTPKTPTQTLDSGKNVRITRHSSPLLLISCSPNSSSRRKEEGETPSDGEEQPSGSQGSQGSQKKGSLQIRGRKSLKELKELREAKESNARLEDVALSKEEESSEAPVAMEEQESLPAAAEEQQKDLNKDTKDKEKERLEKEKDKDKEKDKELPQPPPALPPALALPSPASNRVTRKAHAQELANNTRVTRNRRQSSTVATEPQLPARGRRKKAPAAPPEPLVSAVKRKRSEDDAESELGAKYAKVEVKAPPAGDEEPLATEAAEDVESVTSAVSEELAKTCALQIKQEPHDSDETVASSSLGNVTPARRSRGRPQSRPLPPQLCASPATRATRHSKAGSPGLVATSSSAAVVVEPPAPPKRRRVGSSNRSILLPTAKTASASTTASVSVSASASTSSSAPGAIGDDDSKDSMASSMDDLLLAAADIKQEKHSSDYVELLLYSQESLETEKPLQSAAKATPAEEATSSSSIATLSAANGLQIEPLTVQTEQLTKSLTANEEEEEEGVKLNASEDLDAKPCSSVNSDSDKAPSLSPEMISEGVSAISVKQFYKKPEFLENNLGIEKDPELGEIVQTVSSTEVETETEPEIENENEEAKEEANAKEEEEEEEESPKLDDSLSNTSVQEGELRIDESSDELLPEVDKAKGEEEEESLVLNGVDKEEVEKENEEELLPEEEEEKKPKVEFDAFESEIMEELAKEGVVDASGNALSAKRRSEGEGEEEELEAAKKANECDNEKENSKEERVGTKKEASEEPMEVEEEEELTTTRKSEKTEKPDEKELLKLEAKELLAEISGYPEENKENVVVVAAAAVSQQESSSAAIEIHELKLESEERDEKEQREAKEDLLLSGKVEDEDDLRPDELLSCDEEQRREKERHLENLGLLTHHAAEQIRQEYIAEANTRAAQHQQHQQQHAQLPSKGGRQKAAPGGGGSVSHVESSGTLKTVIKLNRSSNGGAGGSGGLATGTVIHGGAASTISSRKAGQNAGGAGAGHGGVRRQSLKMTFQKGRARGHGNADRSADRPAADGEDSYYTIQNENEGAANLQLGRKSNNRFSSTNHNNNNNSHAHHNLTNHSTNSTTNASSSSRASLDSSHSEGHGGGAEHSFYQTVSTAAACSKKDEKEKILIPEKASSFKFHPGRLCEDQCYYCSGKFGLYDTPCHVGQIKSVERQQKILANEEKLTVDNCLCDACFRHVDRRANAPSYKKRLSAPGHLETGQAEKQFEQPSNSSAADGGDYASGSAGSSTATARICAVKDCLIAANHSLRRKCIRKSVKKLLFNFVIPTGISVVWFCETHYNAVLQSSGCVLCKRRLGKNHMYHITSDTDRLEKALAEMGIPVKLGIGTAVCKLCRYFANLLMKPPDSTKSQKAEFVKNYRKRLLKFHNLLDGSNEASEADEDEGATAAKTDAGQESQEGGAAGGGSAAAEDAEMTVDYDGPTDSNSSSSSTTTTPSLATNTMTTTSSSKQMSKLQAILQQNLSGGGAGAAESATASTAKGKSSDISNVLRGNPNISMRELFHGEEELGVQFKVPFGCSSSQRTPEGWTRVQTFLQYDEPTRRLWEDLQKPYGNQSSFLRHLILLEKYYRNGDLVLAPHASSNASVYTETVRQRLNSFDHGHCGGLSNKSNSASTTPPAAATSATGSVLASVLTAPLHSNATANPNPLETLPPIPLVELNDDDDDEQSEDVPLERLSNASVDKLTKQLSSNAVTIIARFKDQARQATPPTCVEEKKSPPALISESSSSAAPALVPASSASNSRSILKTNLLGMNKSVEIVPLSNITSGGVGVAQHSMLAQKPPGEKQQKILEVANKLLGSQSEAQAAALLALHSKQQKANANASSSSSVSVASSVAGSSSLSQTLPHSISHAQPAAAATLKPQPQLLSSPPELISLHRRRTSGGNNNNNNNAGASLLAGLGLGNSNNNGNSNINANAHLNVNQQRLQLPRQGHSQGHGQGHSHSQGQPRSAPPPPPNVVILPETLTAQERHESKSWKPTLIPLEDQHKVPKKSHALYQTADGRRLPDLVQVQSGGKPYLISIFDYNRMCILRREKLLRDQMLKANNANKSKQTSSSSAAASASQAAAAAAALQASNPAAVVLSSLNKFAQQTARQQLQQLQQQKHHHQMPSLQQGGGGGGAGAAAQSGLRLARFVPKQISPIASPQNAAPPTLTPASSSGAAMDSTSSWLWKNFPEANQYLLNGNGGGNSSANKLPHLSSLPAAGSGGSSSSSKSTLTLKQQQQQQKYFENAIRSKIPKSLTVIPQQMGQSSGQSSSQDSSVAASLMPKE